MDVFCKDIEKITLNNKYFRNVIYTCKGMQVVLMTLLPGKDIGMEVHKNVDQFFRVEEGEGLFIYNNKKKKIKNGTAFVVPRGTYHNVINTGEIPLKLYTIYTPPQHEDGVKQKN